MEVAATLESRLEAHEREVVLRVMAGAAFLVLFQAYLVGAVDTLAKEFGAKCAGGGVVDSGVYVAVWGVDAVLWAAVGLDGAGAGCAAGRCWGRLLGRWWGRRRARTLGELLAWRVFAGGGVGGDCADYSCRLHGGFCFRFAGAR